MNPVRLALVGAGQIAQSYAQVFGTSDSVEIVGVADVNLESAERIASDLGCRAFPGHLELVDGAGAEAVVLCTPPNTHHPIAIDLLGSGLHVMCEKPLALTLDEAVEMLARADAAGLTLTMASKFRYVDEVIEARRISASGALGDVILLENTFASRVDMTQRWNSNTEISGGGVLIDNGTHSVDIVRYFVGPISDVLALEGRRAQEVLVEDTAQVFLRSESGVRATIDLSWSLNKERDWFLEIYGSEGTVQVGWGSSRYRLQGSDGWTVFGKGYDKYQAIRDQVTNFANAIRGEEALVISGLDALASVEVIDAAYRSLRHDDWVKVAPSIIS
ncbi:MAG: Gfo/Idh/MocA family oxidoreductase [Acidimicrobiia bacterium]